MSRETGDPSDMIRLGHKAGRRERRDVDGGLTDRGSGSTRKRKKRAFVGLC